MSYEVKFLGFLFVCQFYTVLYSCINYVFSIPFHRFILHCVLEILSKIISFYDFTKLRRMFMYVYILINDHFWRIVSLR